MPITDPEKKRIAQQARLVMRSASNVDVEMMSGLQDAENAEIHT